MIDTGGNGTAETVEIAAPVTEMTEVEKLQATIDAMRRDMGAIHHMANHITDEVKLIPPKVSWVTSNNIGYAASQIKEWAGRHRYAPWKPEPKDDEKDLPK
jgi:hypothetical protein